MAKKHVQAELESHEYAALQDAARREEMTLKEALREAAVAWARQHRASRDPLFGIVGIGKGATERAAADHDEIYD